MGIISGLDLPILFLDRLPRSLTLATLFSPCLCVLAPLMRSWDLSCCLLSDCQFKADPKLKAQTTLFSPYNFRPRTLFSLSARPWPTPLLSLQGTPTEWDPQMVRARLALKGLMDPAKVSWDKGGRGLAGGAGRQGCSSLMPLGPSHFSQMWMSVRRAGAASMGSVRTPAVGTRACAPTAFCWTHPAAAASVSQ